MKLHRVATFVTTVAAVVFCTPVMADLTGIYVEYYVPETAQNPCGSSPSSVGDGWFPVAGFPSRGAGCPNQSPTNGLPYGADVSFTALPNTIYRVFAVNSDQDIGDITVNGGGTGYTLFVGRPLATSTSNSQPLQVAAGKNIGGISAENAKLQVRSRGAILSVYAKEIVRVDTSGSVGNTQSPWGLFDTSGTRSEFVEDRTVDYGGLTGDRVWVGPAAGPPGLPETWPGFERLGEAGGAGPEFGQYAFRIGTSVVPSPPSLVIAGMTLWAGVKRSRSTTLLS